MKRLQIIDADTLMSTPLPVIRFIVEKLLRHKATCSTGNLASAPKVGTPCP